MNEAFGERNQHVVSGSGTCANAEVQQKVSASGAPIILRVGVALSVSGGRAAVGVVRVVASPVAYHSDGARQGREDQEPDSACYRPRVVQEGTDSCDRAARGKQRAQGAAGDHEEGRAQRHEQTTPGSVVIVRRHRHLRP